MAKLQRIDVWTDRESNGGTRVAFVDPIWCPKIEEYLEVAGREELTVEVEFDQPVWSDLIHNRVLRPVYDDYSYDEYRVKVVTGRRQSSGAVTRRLTAFGIKNDLQSLGRLLEWVQVNGQTLLHHELINVLPTNAIDDVINTGVMDADFVKGTIEQTGRVDLVSAWETPLSAIEELARLTDGELSVRRVGTTQYAIDILEELNSAAEKPVILFGRNELAMALVEDATQFGTLIYPKGEGPQGNEPTIADCYFVVDTANPFGWPSALLWIGHWMGGASGAPWVTNEGDQLKGFYLEEPDGTLHEITGSGIVGINRCLITLAAPVTFDDDLPLRIRANAAGDELVALPSPSGITDYGEVSLVLERLDLPGVTNLVNTGLEPDNWFATGGTKTAVSRPDSRIHFGDENTKFEGDTNDFLFHTGMYMGLLGGIGIPVFVIRESRPHLSFQVYLYVEAGQVEFYAKGFTGVGGSETEVWRYPAFDPDTGTWELDSQGNFVRAVSTAVGAWHHLTLEPQLWNFYDLQQDATPTEHIQLYIHALEDSTVVLVDAVQIVNEVVVAEKFVSGSNQSRLWGAAIQAFRRGAGAPRQTVDVEALDLARRDPSDFPYDVIDRGVTLVLRDPGIGVDLERRIFSVRRDLKREAITPVELIEP